MNRIKLYKPVRLLAAAIIILSALTGGSANAKEIFAELTEMPHVESTFISGKIGHSLMALPEVGRIVRNGVTLDSDDLKAMFIYRCYSEDSVKKAREILSDYVKSHKNVELVMRTRQGGQEFTMYEETKAGNSDSSERAKFIIWTADAPNVCKVVVIDWDEVPDLSDLTKADDPLRYVNGIS